MDEGLKKGWEQLEEGLTKAMGRLSDAIKKAEAEMPDAMKSINEEAAEDAEILKQAPHTTKVGRLDEVGAARKPVLRWKPDSKADSAGSKM